MNALSIVDSHVHLWDPTRLRYPWLDELPALNRAFLPSEFATAASGSSVSKVIFVECGCGPRQNLAEVDWVTSLAKHESRIKGIISHVDLEKGEAIRADLEKLAANPLVKGVRRNLQSESDPEFCLRPEFIAGVKALPEFGFTFDLCIRHEQLRAVTELVRRIPRVTFVLDHFGKPDVRGKKITSWATDLKSLSALPNVACKISGLATEADWNNWQPADLKIYFEHALECFGIDRLLFGGDWPVTTLATDYQRWLETVRELLPFSSFSDQIKLFQINAERIYRV